jgi:hypothetical protein
MNPKKAYFMAALLGIAVCVCLGSLSIGFSVIPSILRGEPTRSYTSNRSTPSDTPFVIAPSILPWDRTRSSILLMTRGATGDVRYRLYDDHGILLRETDEIKTVPPIESIFDADISPDGNFLVAVPRKADLFYRNSGGVVSGELNLFVINLSTGRIQYTAPLLRSPSDLLSQIRNTVAVPYDERMYSSLDDPEAAYEKKMESLVQMAWDGYISELGSHGWSMDGKQLAFTYQSTGTTASLSLLDLQKGSVKSVVEKPVAITSPQWSPDGKRILTKQYQIGNNIDGEWYVDSLDREREILVPDSGDFVRWLNDDAIVHVHGFMPKMYLFDPGSQEDRLFYENSMDGFSVAKDGSFAAVSDPVENGKSNIWYCPFNGEERILLDSVPVPEDNFLGSLTAAVPDRVFLELVKSNHRNGRMMDIWLYGISSGKEIVAEEVSIYSVSPDDAFIAFYSLAEKVLMIKNLNGEKKKWTMEAPERMLWDPRSESLLLQTAEEIGILHVDGEEVDTIAPPSGGAEYIAYWVK